MGPTFKPVKTPAQLLELIKKHKIEMVDVKFADLEGRWFSVTVTANMFNEDAFKKGVAFDGSSIPGFQSIVESDLVLLPAVETAFIDTFSETPTLSIVADPMDPVTGKIEEYHNNPRYIARKAIDYMQSTGIADTMYVGPEIEFFIFDHVQYGSNDDSSFFRVDSDEAAWNNNGDNDNMNHGQRASNQRGYFTVPPFDIYRDIRNDMVRELEAAGVIVERHHHEVGSTGQAEINIRFADMVQQADQVMLYKYIVRNVAARYGKSVTFMPKPLFGHNGSGMHSHQSLWKNGKPLFYDKKGYAGFSELGMHYIGGILHHAKSILAIAASTTNSYKRLTPGYEAPVVRAYSKRNRSAAVRIPIYDQTPAGTRMEFRSADASSNPYLAFSAMLLAGLDGIKNKIEPGDPMDMNLFELSPAQQKKLKFVPASLEEAFDALEKDRDFLVQPGVFTNEFLDNFVDMKTAQMDQVRLRPHPQEFDLYYNL